MKNLGKVRLIAFLLVICTMVSLLPVNAIALSEGASVTSETEGAVNSAVAPKTVADEILEPVIIAEDITKRGETEKHFICDDGSYIAVSYPEAVHEQVNGEWVDIEYDVEAGSDGISPADDSITIFG